MPLNRVQAAVLTVVIVIAASAGLYFMTLQPSTQPATTSSRTVTSTTSTSTTTTTTTTTTTPPPPPKTEITPLTHSAVMLQLKGVTIYVDPYGKNFSTSPKADLILITHTHSDHLDSKSIGQLSREGTKVIAPDAAKNTLPQAIIIKAGDEQTLNEVVIKAVAAYNLERKNPRTGQLYHPKDSGVGYIVTLGGQNIFFAGDTECVPEIKALKNIDVAFLPIDGQYTMNPDEAAQCYKEITPKVAIPYHQNQQDPNKIKDLLADTPSIKVEIYNLP